MTNLREHTGICGLATWARPLIFGLALAGLFTLALRPAFAIQLDLPKGATPSVELSNPFGSTSIPTGVYSNGSVPQLTVEGQISTQTWMISGSVLTTLQILDPMRSQLINAGYQILLDCEADQCGGFDFRYQIQVVPEPEMHVDLGDFRVLSAQNAGDPEAVETVGLIVSRSGDTGFVQIIQVGKRSKIAPTTAATTQPPVDQQTDVPTVDANLAELLISSGRAPLDDLNFVTGSSDLGPGTFASLLALAAFLESNPDKMVALVGHTDAQGSLANNLALSKSRAMSVRGRLLADYGANSAQVEAAGVGYLVPRASNLTQDGRAKNRRVEVILTSTR